MKRWKALVLFLLAVTRLASAQGVSPESRRSAADEGFRAAEALREKGTAVEARAAIEKYQASAAAYRELADPKGEAQALNGLGKCQLGLGEGRKAQEALASALPLARTAGERPLEADILNALGEAHVLLGEQGKALELSLKAARLFRELDDRDSLGLALVDIGQIYDSLGEKEKALGYLDEALPLLRAAGKQAEEGVCLASMGKVADDLGEFQKALDFENRALTLAREGGSLRGEAVMLNNIGLTYYNLGDKERATRLFEDSLVLRRKVGDKRGEARTLTALGRACFDLSQTQRAVDLYAAALSLSLSIEDRSGEAIVHSRMGDLYESQEEWSRALQEHGDALRLRRELGFRGDEPYSQLHVGIVQAALHEPAKAYDSFRLSLELARAVRDPVGEADALRHLAELELDRGEVEKAADDIAKAVATVEALRTHVASPGLRASYFATTQPIHRLEVDVWMARHRKEPDQGFDARALEAAERMRARSLLELLSRAGTRIQEGVDTEMLKRARGLQLLLNAKLDRQMRLLSGAHRDEDVRDVAGEIETLTGALEHVESEIRTASPRYAALMPSHPLSLREIRQSVLDDGTLLLAFALGESRSFVWVVGKTSLSSHELPGRRAIEGPARRLLDAVGMRTESAPGESPASHGVRIDRAEAAFARATVELGGILFGALGRELGNARLLIVPDGILQYVPFGALHEPDTAGTGPAKPLVLQHEVVTLPSASILPILRRDRAAHVAAPRTVVIIADPVFSADDARVTLQAAGPAARPASPADASDEFMRSASEAGLEGGRLSRLPFTRREANDIVDLVPPGLGKESLDFEASRATALSGSLSDFRFVHFATHGFLNAQHPELSGLVLSLVDRQGRATPGFLSAIDVYNMKLNADLVVLSGCRTALGKDIKGEGLLGMTRGFMYAGVPRVVASLWKVDDAATAVLMRSFYAGMLGPKKLRPAAALRQAQIEMEKQQRWRDPYYWAAFVLQGEWN